MGPPLLGMLLLVSAIAVGNAQGAEVRGQIELGTGRIGPVSVALLPLDGQRLPKAEPQERVVRMRDRQFDPPYLVAQVGDRLQFINDDDVYHVLMSPYGPQAFEATLGVAGGEGARTSLALSRAGTLYVFCRIHHRVYMHVDVFDTPLSKMLGADGAFEFRNVPAGRWRLRVASRGGDPLYRELTAFTAPPPILLTLPAMEADAAAGLAHGTERVERLYPSGGMRP